MGEDVTQIHGGEVSLCPDPIFVIGAPRSGTTGLAWALAQHDDFWTSQETQILFALFGNGRIEGQIDRWLGRPVGSWLRAENVTRPEFLGYLGLGLNALFTNRSSDRRWIDHTPHHAFMVDVLVDMFPGAYFLHILRDGRAAVHSMVNIENTLSEDERKQMSDGNFLPPWSKDFRAACLVWRDSVEAGMWAQERYPKRCLTVLHSELSSDADTAFRNIFRFIGAYDDDGPARYWQTTKINSSFRSRSAEIGLSGGSSRWAEWTSEQRAIFADVAGPMLIKCGLALLDDLDMRDCETPATTGAGK